MKKFKGICFLLIIVFYFSACNNVGEKKRDTEENLTDSLFTKYRSMGPNDPNKVIRLVRKVQSSTKDSTNYYKLETILFRCYLSLSKWDECREVNNSVLSYCKRKENGRKNERLYELKAISYNDAGILYMNAGKAKNAENAFLQAIRSLCHNTNREKLPDLYINLADNYWQTGDFINTSKVYRDALRIADSLKMSDKYDGSIYSGLARLYTNLENYPMADSYYKRIESMEGKLTLYERSFFYIARGNYYYDTKEYAKALPWFYKAYDISLKYPEFDIKGVAECDLGEIYLLLNRTDSAKYFLDRAEKTLLVPGAPVATSFYVKGLYASYYLKTGKLEKASEILSAPYDKALIPPLYAYYNNKRLEQLYSKEKQYKKAYEYGLKAEQFDDSLRSVSIRNNIEEIDARYRRDTSLLKKNILIGQKEQRVLQLKNANILILSLFILFLLFSFTIYINYKRKREIRSNRQLALVTKLRMQNVRNRISPHFIFNVLNFIIPNLRNNEKLMKPLESLVHMIRSNLIVSDKIAIPLSEEIGIVKDYLALYASLNEKIPEIIWKVNENADLDIKVPSMIIQIPVENAVKYAFDKKTENGRIAISIEEAGEYLLIEVDDNGVGFDPGKNASPRSGGSGNGLKIVYKTIEILNRRNSQAIEFNILNKAEKAGNSEGTLVRIRVPKKYNFDL